MKFLCPVGFLNVSGGFQKCREADLFAMALLMPEKAIKQQFPRYKTNLGLRKMAKKFKVDYGMLLFRLGQLGLFTEGIFEPEAKC